MSTVTGVVCQDCNLIIHLCICPKGPKLEDIEIADRYHRALSDREREVLLLLAGGKTNNEIGKVLGISPLTAKNHVTKAMKKLGSVNRTAIIADAFTHGILKVERGKVILMPYHDRRSDQFFRDRALPPGHPDARMTRDEALHVMMGYRLMLASDGRTTTNHLLAHVRDMPMRIQASENTDKVMRWLGYMQGVLHATGVYTLDQLKEHSKRRSVT